LYGTAGDDVLVGSAGHDRLDTSGGGLGVAGGIDFICGGGGGDQIILYGRGSRADGGSGDDGIESGEGAFAFGGPDNDNVVADSPGGVADGGSGDDNVFVRNFAVALGGPGNDVVGGYDARALLGDSGSDHVANHHGAPGIDCGTDFDWVFANGDPYVSNCEGTFVPDIIVGP
jgi:hypothetical protein